MEENIYRNPPKNEELDSFKSYVTNMKDDILNEARSNADTVSTKVKDEAYKSAAEYLLQMVFSSISCNELESPRKVIDTIKKSKKFSSLAEEEFFTIAEKLLESFEEKDLEKFVQSMDNILENVFGNVSSIEVRLTTLKDLHCAFFAYTQ